MAEKHFLHYAWAAAPAVKIQSFAPAAEWIVQGERTASWGDAAGAFSVLHVVSERDCDDILMFG
jgi:hypothetical protein